MCPSFEDFLFANAVDAEIAAKGDFYDPPEAEPESGTKDTLREALFAEMKSYEKLDKASSDKELEKIALTFSKLLEEGDDETVLKYVNDPESDWKTVAALRGILKVYPDADEIRRFLGAVYKLRQKIPFRDSSWLSAQDQAKMNALAFENAQELAMLGDTDALFETAQRYACGFGTGADEKKAEALLKLCDELGHPLAEEALDVLERDDEAKERSKKTYPRFRDAKEPELNMAAAKMALLAKGTIYSEINYLNNLEKAAAHGSTEAMMDAIRYWMKQPGFCCRMDVIRDMGERAAKAGEPEGLYLIGSILEDRDDPVHYREAWEYYTDAEKAGSSSAKERCERFRGEEQKKAYIEGLQSYSDGDYQDAFDSFYPLVLLGNNRALQLSEEMLDREQVRTDGLDQLLRVYLLCCEKHTDLDKALKIAKIYMAKKDYNNAKVWGEKCADAKMPEAYVFLVHLGAYSGEYYLTDLYAYEGAQSGDPLCQYFEAAHLVKNMSYYTLLEDQASFVEEARKYALKAKAGGIKAADKLLSVISDISAEVHDALAEQQERAYAQLVREQNQRMQEEQDRQRWVSQLQAEVDARYRIYSKSFGVEDSHGNYGEVSALSGRVQMNDGSSGYVDQLALRNLQQQSLQDALDKIYNNK
ncbi:MAG: hypothetical protein IJK25_11735 [Firmicutes bacterium]|nr:hypothetical protein [Bacillota bacterium]